MTSISEGSDATIVAVEETVEPSPELLGGKGASLVTMRRRGLPVPPAFVIPTTACRAYMETGALPAALEQQIAAGVEGIEQAVGRTFGSPQSPLLVSVRSGAPVSMPGMMDTILNVGLCESTIDGFAQAIGDEAAAGDAYARLVRAFAGSVLGIPDETLDEVDRSAGADGDRRREVAALLELVESASGSPFPQDPQEQLSSAVEAVMRSWTAPRAVRYRKYAGISESLGTAVIVQAMVFGNLSGRSGTGVAFSRNPSDGTVGLYGDFLPNAQGEDVVNGENTLDARGLELLRDLAPAARDELEVAVRGLEQELNDLCEVEFTVERERLWILQTRRGQRSGVAAVRIALELLEQSRIAWEDMASRVPPGALTILKRPVLADDPGRSPIGLGVDASPGVAIGRIARSSQVAEEMAAAGHGVILVRPHTSPTDIAGMIAADGIVTQHGGRTSHAAVVARGMGRPAVCGVESLDLQPHVARFGRRELEEGDLLTIDGATGEVFDGALRTVAAPADERIERFLSLCDRNRRAPVLARGQREPWADGTLEGGEVCRSAEALESLTAEVGLVELDGGGDVRGLLARAQSMADAGRRLILIVPQEWPSQLKELPVAAWSAFAADESTSWTARFLAATAVPAEAGANPLTTGNRS